MADTQALVISLAKSLPEPARGYTLYLDNLFTNVGESCRKLRQSEQTKG